MGQIRNSMTGEERDPADLPLRGSTRNEQISNLQAAGWIIDDATMPRVEETPDSKLVPPDTRGEDIKLTLEGGAEEEETPPETPPPEETAETPGGEDA
jgi:hypothetical protein